MLSRARPKKLAHDYLEGGWASPPLNESVRDRAARAAEIEPGAPAKDVADTPEILSLADRQLQARENWLAYKAKSPNNALSIEKQQRQARERWQDYQQSKSAESERGEEAAREKDQTQEKEKPFDHGIDHDLS